MFANSVEHRGQVAVMFATFRSVAIAYVSLVK